MPVPFLHPLPISVQIVSLIMLKLIFITISVHITYVCMYVCSIFYGTMNGGTVSCRNVNVSNAVNDVISWNVIGIRFQDKKCE